ncbi:MAG: class II aldolase/adducin family protein [Gammaproteobacteria bacterium]|nr:class II aldolase/adducin family protein [Gammaproteobacteria bacterium]
MNSAEKELRTQLAACYRIFAFLDWDELIFNHITVRLPGDDHHFLINPYGLHYSEVTASNLVKVDIEGNIIEHSDYPVNPAGMLIHSAIHGSRDDAHCIGHIHSDAGMTVACQQDGLRIDNFYSVLLYGQVAYHDFQGITVMPGEKEALINSLGDKNFLILRSHGLLTCGQTIAEMFFRMFSLQRACEIQAQVDMTGKPVVPVGLDIAERSLELLALQMANSPGGAGDMEFAAMQRRIDRIDDSYRDV